MSSGSCSRTSAPSSAASPPHPVLFAAARQPRLVRQPRHLHQAVPRQAVVLRLAGPSTRQLLRPPLCRTSWWLVGVDVQLGSRHRRQPGRLLPRPRRAHGPRARIILCTAEPHLGPRPRAARPPGAGSPRPRRQPRLPRAPVRPADPRVPVRRPPRHYRRHASADGQVQKITAGGGGASSPTSPTSSTTTCWPAVTWPALRLPRSRGLAPPGLGTTSPSRWKTRPSAQSPASSTS